MGLVREHLLVPFSQEIYKSLPSASFYISFNLSFVVFRTYFLFFNKYIFRNLIRYRLEFFNRCMVMISHHFAITNIHGRSSCKNKTCRLIIGRCNNKRLEIMLERLSFCMRQGVSSHSALTLVHHCSWYQN